MPRMSSAYSSCWNSIVQDHLWVRGCNLMGKNKRVISVNWVNTHLFQGTPTLISTLLPTDLSSSSEALRGVSVVTVRNSALASTAFHSNIEMTSPALQTGSALSNCGIKHKSFILCYKNTPQADTKKNRTVLPLPCNRTKPSPTDMSQGKHKIVLPGMVDTA